MSDSPTPTSPEEVESELIKLCGSKTAVFCFGGMNKVMGGIPPFEFLNYISKHYENQADLYFYRDNHQCCYHKGLANISTDIESTQQYLTNKIKTNNYEKTIFVGNSSGAYGAILFGSLCKATHVIGFTPKTILKPRPNTRHHHLAKILDKKYANLKEFMNPTTQYILYGDPTIKNRKDNHHILQCKNLTGTDNVKLIKIPNFTVRKLRDSDELKTVFIDILTPNPDSS